jgi:hypothetical protein
MGVAYSKWCAKLRYSRGKQCQNLLTKIFGFFSCNLKNPWYNVDIRSKRERKKEREKEKWKKPLTSTVSQTTFLRLLKRRFGK